MAGLTFDSGVLISLERRQQRATDVFRVAVARQLRITVPAPCVTEWWRGRTDFREKLLFSVHVEPLDAELARLAGTALAKVKGATAIDAIVMASAALRGDLVYTSDFDDLDRLRGCFPGVRVLKI